MASQQGGSEEDDVARLRRENAELKSKLARQKEPEGGGGFLDGLAKTFGFGKTEEEKALEKQKKQMDNAIDEVFKGGGLVGGLMGSLAKGVVGAAGKMFAETQGDMDAVLAGKAIENRLRDRLGDDVQCAMPMQQMYSSSINGNVVKQVQLVTSASGSRAPASSARRRPSTARATSPSNRLLTSTGATSWPGPFGGGGRQETDHRVWPGCDVPARVFLSRSGPYGRDRVNC